MPIRIRDTIVIPDDELRWRFSRSGGPGGQHVNTTDSRTELSFDVAASRALDEPTRRRIVAALEHRMDGDVLTVVAAEHRNRVEAMRRLAQLLEDALRPAPPPRRPTAPSRSARARRVDQKKQRGRTKRLRRRPDDG